MDIKIGRFRLTSDDRQFIVSQFKTNRKGANAGKKVEINFTYHTSLIDAFRNIYKRKVLASKVESVEEVITLLKEQNKYLQELFAITLKEGK